MSSFVHPLRLRSIYPLIKYNKQGSKFDERPQKVTVKQFAGIY